MGFDIGVTTLLQSTLLERSVKSNQAVDSLGAATHMFDEKTHKYRNSHYDVYPIIFLATGRPSNHMKKMLAAIEPHIAIGNKKRGSSFPPRSQQPLPTGPAGDAGELAIAGRCPFHTIW